MRSNAPIVTLVILHLRQSLLTSTVLANVKRPGLIGHTRFICDTQNYFGYDCLMATFGSNVDAGRSLAYNPQTPMLPAPFR